MSTGYGWEGLRQVCATLLGARHVPERLCGGLVYLGRYNKCSPIPFLPFLQLNWTEPPEFPRLELPQLSSCCTTTRYDRLILSNSWATCWLRSITAHCTWMFN